MSNKIYISSTGIDMSIISDEKHSKYNTAGSSGITNEGNTCYMNSSIQILSNLYLLRHYLFANEKELNRILLDNAPKYTKNDLAFKKSDELKNEFEKNKFTERKKCALLAIKETITDELIDKLRNPKYHSNHLTDKEKIILLNTTMTRQLTKLLSGLWSENCVIEPIGFLHVFKRARNLFFFSNTQHDCEEAYTCIIDRIREELGQEKRIDFVIDESKYNLSNYLDIEKAYKKKIKDTENPQIQIDLQRQFRDETKHMRNEKLLLSSFAAMRRHYSKSYSWISELFTGFLHSSLSCPSCLHISDKFDPFSNLAVEITSNNRTNISIYDLLESYCKEEKLEKGCEWRCSSCDQKVRASKKLEIWSCPEILTIQIKRFDQLRSRKNNTRIYYPISKLNMSKFISPIYSDANNIYNLQAVACHRGNFDSSGHYYTYAKSKGGNWRRFDDDEVDIIPEQAVSTSDAYLLVYVRDNK
jgi:ubiquitin C-terminal hydrolase